MGKFGAPDELYRNDGGSEFTKLNGSMITFGQSDTTAVAWGDIDCDGDLVRRRRALSASGCVRACARAIAAQHT